MSKSCATCFYRYSCRIKNDNDGKPLAGFACWLRKLDEVRR